MKDRPLEKLMNGRELIINGRGKMEMMENLYFFSPMLFIIVQVLETRVFYRKERKICRASEIISK